MDQELAFRGDAGELEARLSRPTARAAFRCVVAHPHPLYGGTMDNLTTVVLSRRLVAAGGVVLRFNFRGVGASHGSFDRGRGELDDLRASEEYLARLEPELPAWLAGYSFGAAMVLLRSVETAASSTSVRLIALAPPIHHYDFSALEQSKTPLGLVCGERDELTPYSTIEELTGGWPGVVAVEWIRAAGHDLGASTGKLDRAVDQVVEALNGRSERRPCPST